MADECPIRKSYTMTILAPSFLNGKTWIDVDHDKIRDFLFAYHPPDIPGHRFLGKREKLDTVALFDLFGVSVISPEMNNYLNELKIKLFASGGLPPSNRNAR